MIHQLQQIEERIFDHPCGYTWGSRPKGEIVDYVVLCWIFIHRMEKKLDKDDTPEFGRKMKEKN